MFPRVGNFQNVKFFTNFFKFLFNLVFSFSSSAPMDIQFAAFGRQ